MSSTNQSPLEARLAGIEEAARELDSYGALDMAEVVRELTAKFNVTRGAIQAALKRA